MSNRRKSRKSFTLTIHGYHGIIVLPHLIDLSRMVLLHERYAELKKELLPCCCNLAWMQLIPWNATVICEMFSTSWQMGKHLTKGGSENHFLKAQFFRSEQWLKIIRYLRRTSQGATNLVRKLPGIFLGCVLIAEGILKGDRCRH